MDIVCHWWTRNSKLMTKNSRGVLTQLLLLLLFLYSSRRIMARGRLILYIYIGGARKKRRGRAETLRSRHRPLSRVQGRREVGYGREDCYLNYSIFSWGRCKLGGSAALRPALSSARSMKFSRSSLRDAVQVLEVECSPGDRIEVGVPCLSAGRAREGAQGRDGVTSSRS